MTPASERQRNNRIAELFDAECLRLKVVEGPNGGCRFTDFLSAVRDEAQLDMLMELQRRDNRDTLLVDSQ